MQVWSGVAADAPSRPATAAEQCRALIGDSGEAERTFRRELERRSEMNPNTTGA